MRAPLAALLLAAALVAGGCADRREAYCAAVADRQDELGTAAAGGGGDALISALPIFEDLAEDAPPDIADDWRLVIERVRGLEAALAAAGVDPATYTAEAPPPGLTPADRAAIERAARRLGDRQGREALGHVEQHAQDVCHTPLAL